MSKKNRDFDHYFAVKPKSKPRLGLIRTYFRDVPFELLTASGVFSKDKVDLGTRLLIDSMVLPERGNVLDIGCGYGAVGIASAAFNPLLNVFLIDVNHRAIWLTRQNIERNRLNNAEARRGYMYEPVANLKFDCILSNPPISAGMKTVKAIICEAPHHMTFGGLLQIVVRSKIAGKRLSGFFEEAFGSVEVLARKSGYRVLTSKKPK